MGPLNGLRVLEFAGIGPMPMCAMLLADLGATVLRLERPGGSDLGVRMPARFNVTNRNRHAIAIDLRKPEGVALALGLVARAQALIEGFRPGTMERMGLGPEPCLARNPGLVYGRLSGWGRQGPLAGAAGHDLNYIALSGARDAIGRRGQPPTPPLNLVGDYGGGALHLALGLVSAMLHVARGGEGQVVDASILGGATSLMTFLYGLRAAGVVSGPRGTNIIDSGAPFYDVYACADGAYVSVAAIEKKFRRELFSRIGIAPEWVERSDHKENWEELRGLLERIFRSKPRDAWCALLEGTDACFAPVLSMAEAPAHPQNQACASFITLSGVVQPGPALHFGRTMAAMPNPPDEAAGVNAEALLADWGFTTAEIARYRESGAVAGPG